MSSNRKYYIGFDYLRFICCILILMLHTNVIEYQSVIDISILQFATPIFFCISGFLYAEKIIWGGQIGISARNYIKKLLPTLIFFESFNIVLNVITMIQNGNSLMKISALVIRSILFYPYGSMWYIQALMIDILIISFLYKKKRLKLGLIISFLLFMVSLIDTSYHWIIDGTILDTVDYYYRLCFVTTRNGIFYGFVFVMLGFVLRLKGNVITEWLENHIWILGFVLIIYIAEAYLIFCNSSELKTCMITQVFMTPTVVWLCAKICAKKNPFSVFCSTISGGVYFVHRAVLGTLVLFGFVSGTGWLSFGILLVLCCLLCWMAHKTNNRYVKAVFGIT